MKPLTLHVSPRYMLRQLDAQLEQLGVAEYGVSQVTMEEVFLKVGKSATAAASGGTEASLQRSTSATDTPLRLTNMAAHEVFVRHLAALTVKRVHYGRQANPILLIYALL